MTYLANKLTLSVVLAIAVLTLYSLTPSSQGSQPPHFEKWVSQYSHLVHIKPEEMVYRARIFEDNLKKINEHNSQEGKSYKLGVNQFTAYTQQEFETMFLSPIEAPKPEVKNEASESKLKWPVDWVSYGAVSPVKNQGACTATYAFSTIGGIEGVSVIYLKSQTEYSVQQIVDCTVSYGNDGCHTGTMVNSYQYILARGINTEASYPYRGSYGQCRYPSGTFRISSYKSIYYCTDLDNALMNQPISVAVDGNNFRNYHSGILDTCGQNLNLAALLVAATDNYYKLKNSWGTSWGEAGYIRLLKNGNICGICNAASYPVV